MNLWVRLQILNPNWIHIKPFSREAAPLAHGLPASGFNWVYLFANHYNQSTLPFCQTLCSCQVLCKSISIKPLIWIQSVCVFSEDAGGCTPALTYGEFITIKLSSFWDYLSGSKQRAPTHCVSEARVSY